MPVNIQDLIDVLAEICDNKQLKGCIKSSFQGSLLTGCSALVGGLLLGRMGLAIGGALGGAVAAVASSNFEPVGKILKDMNQTQKEKLYQRIKYAFRNFGAQDVVAITALIMSQTSFKEVAIKEVTNYLTSDLGVTLQV